MTSTQRTDESRLSPENVALRSLQAMSDGDLPAFTACTSPTAVNREAHAEPPACRTGGPAGFLASARWLHSAFADLSWTVEDVAATGDLVAVGCRMQGRQHGTFGVYGADGRVRQAFPSRGRAFSVVQTHWFRVQGGLVVEHWAVRDDLGLAEQLGWVPPSPRYLVRMALARRALRTQ